MNYDFYLKKIGQITPAQLEALQEYIAALDYDEKTTFWDQSRHVGITGLRFGEADRGPLVDVLANPVFESLGKFFNYEIDVLHAGGHIKWHTDVTTIGERCAQMHRVHIPCTGQGEYHFQRYGRPETLEILGMELGGIYLFNNHTYHRVMNKTTEARANIMLNFDAPKM